MNTLIDTQVNGERIQLVPASDADCEFSYQVKKAAEGDLIHRVFGWNEAFQRDFHRNEWTHRRPGMIRLGGKRIGTIAVIEGSGCIEIGQFFILPEYQNRGIGTQLLREVLRRADAKGVPARLAVLQGNRAEALYQRNGFRCVRQSQTHRYLEREPRAYSAT